MPGWLIDLFGSRQVNEAFLFITLAPLPIWFALVFLPNKRWTRWISSPFLAPPLLGVLYLVLVWNLFDLGAPGAPDVAHKSVRGFLRHPLVFLVLWAHLQMANLFVAVVLREDARLRRMAIPVELALCWLFAPLAVVIYTVRRLIRRLSLPDSR
jgi:hypothetical protein